MSRIAFTTNFTQTGLNMLTQETNTLGLSRSSYLESLMVEKLWKEGFLPSNDEIQILQSEFLMNSISTVTLDFRNQLQHLSPRARFSLIALFCGMNLIGGVTLHAKKQANIRKNGALVGYFGVGIIGKAQKPVYDYVQNLTNINLHVLGSKINFPKDEYIFLSCKQQFIKTSVQYPLFNTLCTKLGIPQNTEIIQIHFSEFEYLLDKFKQL